MTPIRIGLISQTASADDAAVRAVAAALNTQAARDVGPVWGVGATVEAFAAGTSVPAGVSPIFIVDDTPNHVGGLHTNTDTGLPWAIVLVSRDWHLAASHEMIELLVDPTGKRMASGVGLQVVNGVVQDGTERVQYVVEACDPMEDPAHAYAIDGLAVSDFYTPRYFDDAVEAGVAYSFNGSVTRPRQVRENGYLSWMNGSNRIQQLRWFGAPAIIELGDHTTATTQDGLPLSHREFIDRHTRTPRQISAHAA